MTKKAKWTLVQWIAFGNRVKKLKADLYLVVDDATLLNMVRQISELWKMDAKIDIFKSKMENLAAEDVPEDLVTRIFYGEQLPENEDDAREFIQDLIRPPAAKPVASPASKMCPNLPGDSGYNPDALTFATPDVESPDDWVTQDHVPPREGFDQVQWTAKPTEWVNAREGWGEHEVHGHYDRGDDTVLSVRCLRKNLPPAAKPSHPEWPK